jgi:hypothetical protein
MRSIYLLALVIGLSACADQPAKTLDEKLAGKTPAEKQEILRLECLNEAERVGNPPRKQMPAHRPYVRKDTQQTHRLKDICRGLTENYSPTDDAK